MRRTSVIPLALAGALAVLCSPAKSDAAANLLIVNGNDPNVGFNDPTAAAPVGGNAGTTVGQQRLVAFKYAAVIWGAAIDSQVPINIKATFEGLMCSATNGVLGAAGPAYVVSNNPMLPLPNSWYSGALGSALIHTDQSPGNPAINARFNSNVGGATCLSTSSWYYGLDGNVSGTQLDLVAIVLHEFAHGLGFFTATDGSTGQYFAPPGGVGRPDIFDHFLFDLTKAKLWDQMTDAERVASAINTRKLVWNGQNTTAQVPAVLQRGLPTLTVNAPVAIQGEYVVGEATFGPALTNTPVSGALQVPSDPFGCTALNSLPSNTVALVDRGPGGADTACTFILKVKNAQTAGAVGVVVVNNVAGSPPPAMGTNDSTTTITIPSVQITQAAGTAIKNALMGGPVTVTLRTLDVLAGADSDSTHRALLYTPDPFKGGSSIPHNDTSTKPHLLMEPDYSTSLGHNLDLTAYFLKDLGWTVANPNPSPLSADISITVSAPASVHPGSDATYTVKVSNAGPSTAADVEVFNTPPTGISFAANAGDCTVFPCLLGTIPAGSSTTFTSRFSVPSSYKQPTTVTNAFNAVSPVPDPVTNNNAATGTSTLGSASGCSSSGSSDLHLFAAAAAILLALRLRQRSALSLAGTRRLR